MEHLLSINGNKERKKSLLLAQFKADNARNFPLRRAEIGPKMRVI